MCGCDVGWQPSVRTGLSKLFYSIYARNADAALQALKDCQCPTARVLRRAEGAEAAQLVTVPAAELVPGDVVTVRFEGDVWMREKGQGERRGGANGEGRRMRRSVHCTMQCLLVVSAQ